MAARVFRIFFATVLLVSTAGLVFADAEQSSTVAEVNGAAISSFDVRREMNLMYQQAVTQGYMPDQSELDVYWNQALQSLIGRELLMQDADSKNYKADPVEVDSYINALTMNYGGSEGLEAALDQQGMTLEKLRNDTMRYQVISEFVEKELRPGVVVTMEEAEKYYSENKEYFNTEETVTASHILLTVPEDADEEQRSEIYEKISGIRERITAGESFEDLAREFSDCPSAERGGDLGEFGHGMMVPPFDKAAFELEPGELSEPVLTQFGYHLIKLTEKNVSQTIQFSECNNQIIDYLTDVKIEEEVNRLVAELWEKAEINFF